MSDNPIIAKMRQALILLSKDKEAGTKLFTEVAHDIDALELQLIEYQTFNDIDPPRFSEPRFILFTRDSGSLILPVKEGESAGVSYELTIRADTIQELALHTISAQNYLLSRGFKTKDTYFDERRAERQDTPLAASPKVAAAQPQNGELTFRCQEMLPMAKSQNDPSPIWKVQGDKSKYPVPFYDLEDVTVDRLDEQRTYLSDNGIDPLTMLNNNKAVKYDLAGWIATYVTNDKGYPAKVTGLIKAS